VTTADKDRKIVIASEEGNNEELIYVPITICDHNGNVATDNDIIIEIIVEGSADLIGFGSGNPKTNYNYNEIITETFHGRALAILKKNGNSGSVIVKVSSEQYQEEIITIA
jgi:beta-galactosidase